MVAVHRSSLNQFFFGVRHKKLVTLRKASAEMKLMEEDETVNSKRTSHEEAQSLEEKGRE